MKIEHVHVISDALMKFLDENDEHKEGDGISKVCDSVVRLMPDIVVVCQYSFLFISFANSMKYSPNVYVSFCVQNTLYNQKKRKGVLYNKLFYRKYGPPATRRKKNETKTKSTTI